MSTDELSARERAEQARRQAEEARRTAMHHAAARRAAQDAARRGIPNRRPPALQPKPGVAFRGGGTVADPTAPMATHPPAPRPTAPATPTTGRPSPPREEPEAGGEAEQAAEPAVRPSSSATRRLISEEMPGVPTGPAEPSAVVEAPAIQEEGHRRGHLTGEPIDIPALPGPPRTAADEEITEPEPAVGEPAHPAIEEPADRLELPLPPRTPDGTPRVEVAEGPPPEAAETVEAAPAEAATPTEHADGLILPQPPRPAPAEAAVPAEEEAIAEQAGEGPAITAAEDEPTLAPGVPAPTAAAPAVAEPEAPVQQATEDARLDPNRTADLGQIAGLLPSAAAPPPDAQVGPVTEQPEVAEQAQPGPAEERDEVAEQAQPGPAEEPDEGVEVAEPEDRPWTRLYPPGVPDTYRYPLVPVTRFLDDAAQDFPDTTAVSYLGAETSYRALSEQVDRLAAALRDMGLGQDDRLGLVLPWCPQLLIGLHACWRGGITAVVVDPNDPPQVLLDKLASARPTALLVVDTAYPALATARGQLDSVNHVITTGLLDPLPAIRARVQAVRLRIPTVQIPADDGALRLLDILDQTPPTGTQADLATDENVAVMVAGDSGPVSATHANLVAASFQMRLWIPDVQAGREGVVVAGSPASVFTLGAGLGQAMLSASTVILPEPRPGGTARTIDDMRPTLLVGTDTGLAEVLAPESKRRDLTSIRVTLSSAPAVEPAMADAMESRTRGRFRTTISADQVGGMVAAQPVYGQARPEIQGLPVTDTDMVAAAPDADGNGTLMARGPQVPGPPGEWVSTGLLGSVDERGQVRVVGPADRVVAHSRGSSDPALVATALRRMDGVTDVSVRTELVRKGSDEPAAGADDGETVLVVNATVTDDTMTAESLEHALTAALPNQAPPGLWNLTLAPQPEPEADAAADPGAPAEQTPAGQDVQEGEPGTGGPSRSDDAPTDELPTAPS